MSLFRIFVQSAVCAFVISTITHAQAQFSTSLHATREGKSFWYDQGAKLLLNIDIVDLGCKGCHGPTNADGQPYGNYTPGCVDCHPSGDFSKAGLKEAQCFGCHSRQNTEANVLALPDVHRERGMKCWDCHKSNEMHGDGTWYNSLHEPGAMTTDCTNCHTSLPSSHASNDPHAGKLHCSACHTKTVVSCYNCHIESQQTAQLKRAKQVIKDFVMLVNRTKDGKVGTASFQSLTYQGKSFVAFGPFHGHAITEDGRRCVDCHVNYGGNVPAILEYNASGRMQFARWNTADSTLSWLKGVIPLPYDYEQSLHMDFLTYNGAATDPVVPSKNWSLVSSAWDGQHMLFATPLSTSQMSKLGFIITSVERLGDASHEFALRPNYPNPFNPSTPIEYALPRATDAQLRVFDAQGRCVRTLLNERQEAGVYRIEADLSTLPAGVYLYALESAGLRLTRKMVLVK